MLHLCAANFIVRAAAEFVHTTDIKRVDQIACSLLGPWLEPRVARAQLIHERRLK
jgi:hypothetical protein